MLDALNRKTESFFQAIQEKPFGFFFFLLAGNIVFKFYNVTFGSFDLDEATHTFYSVMSFPDLIAMAGNDPNPPLYNILIRLWIKVFGLSELGIRSFSVLLSALTAALIFLFCRKFISIQVAVFGSLLFTFSSVQFFYAHNARVYALVGLFTVLSFYFFFRVLNSQETLLNALLYFFVSTLLLYTHVAPVYLFVVQFLVSLFYVRINRTGLILTVTGQILAVVSFIPWLLWSPYYNKPAPTSWEKPPSLGKVYELLADYFNSYWLFYIFAATLLFFLFLLIFKKIQFGTSSGKTVFVALLLWGILPIVLNFIVSNTIVPIFIRRYMVYSSTGLYLLFVFIIWQLPLRSLQRTLISVALLVCFILTVNTRTFIGEQWREAVAHVKENKTPATLVLVSPFFEYPSFAFYYDKKYYRDYKKTLTHLSGENIYMADNPSVFKTVNIDDFKKIILLTSQREVVDPGLLLAYMKKNMALLGTTEFYGISSYLFLGNKSPETVKTYSLDFDSEPTEKKEDIVDSLLAHSGKRLSKTTPVYPYSTGLTIPMSAFVETPAFAEITAWCYYSKSNLCKGLLVASLESNGKSYQYLSVPVEEKTIPGQWQQLSLQINIPRLKSRNDVLKIYVWNTGSSTILTDDIQVIFKN